MIEKAKTLLLSLTPIALMYIIQIAAALGGQILIIWANQFMAMAHVYQSPVLQYAVDQYVYIVSAASYGLFFLVGYFWYRRIVADRRAVYLERGYKPALDSGAITGIFITVPPGCSQQSSGYTGSGGTAFDGTVYESDGRSGSGETICRIHALCGCDGAFGGRTSDARALSENIGKKLSLLGCKFFPGIVFRYLSYESHTGVLYLCDRIDSGKACKEIRYPEGIHTLPLYY